MSSPDGIYLLLNMPANSFSNFSVNFGSLGYCFSPLSILVVDGAGKLAADGLPSKRDGGVRKPTLDARKPTLDARGYGI